MWNRGSLLGLCCALLCGAGLAYFVRDVMLNPYEGRISLATDQANYRDIEQLVRSPTDFRNFAAANGLTQRPEFHSYDRQLTNGSRGPSRMEFTYRFSKRDLRDVPEALVKEVVEKAVSQQVAQRQSAVGGAGEIRIATEGKDPESTAAQADFLVQYVRHILAFGALRKSLHQWGPLARQDLTAQRQIILDTEVALDTVERKLASLGALRDKYKDFREAISAAPTAVQVQVNSSKNLSPLQQIIGFEIDQIDLREQIKSAQINTRRLDYLIKFAEHFEQRVREPKPFSAVAEEMNRWFTEQPKPAETNKEAVQALERARSSVAVTLASIRAQFIEIPAEPERAAVFPQYLARPLALMIGALFGLLAWLIFTRREQIIAAIRYNLAG
jgi:hypothetical protein